MIDIKAGRSRILGGIRASHAIIPLRLSSTFGIEIRFTALVTEATDNSTFHSLFVALKIGYNQTEKGERKKRKKKEEGKKRFTTIRE